jgi:hypothetical protein
VGSTLTVENFSILLFIFECTPPLAEFSVFNFTIFVRIPKFEKKNVTLGKEPYRGSSWSLKKPDL